MGNFCRDAVFGDKTIFPDGLISMESGQLTGREHKQADEAILIAQWHDVDVVVIEDFELRKLLKSKELLSPVRIGHMISYGIHRLNSANPLSTDTPLKIEWQLPALAMTTATDDRLKIWDIYKRGQEHARDAVRHVATFARRAKSERDLRERMWE